MTTSYVIINSEFSIPILRTIIKIKLKKAVTSRICKERLSTKRIKKMLGKYNGMIPYV